MSHRQISFKQWCQQYPAGVIIDVRSPWEFSGLHIRGSVNLPLGGCDAAALAEVLQTAGHDADAPVCLICRSGGRAAMASRQLAGRKGDLLLMDCGVAAIDKALLQSTRPTLRQRLISLFTGKRNV